MRKYSLTKFNKWKLLRRYQTPHTPYFACDLLRKSNIYNTKHHTSTTKNPTQQTQSRTKPHTFTNMIPTQQTLSIPLMDTRMGIVWSILHFYILYTSNLRIATVSDLALADGSRINKNLMMGNEGLSPTPSRWAYTWPNVPPPTTSEKRSWTSSLCMIMHVTTAEPTLATTNYRWFHPECIKLACWNINHKCGLIFQKTENQWIIWEPENSQWRQRTGCTSSFIKTNRTTNVLDRKDQCRSISIEKLHETKITVNARGRYHYQIEEQVEEITWFSPEKSRISNSTNETFLTAVQ